MNIDHQHCSRPGQRWTDFRSGSPFSSKSKVGVTADCSYVTVVVHLCVYFPTHYPPPWKRAMHTLCSTNSKREDMLTANEKFYQQFLCHVTSKARQISGSSFVSLRFKVMAHSLRSCPSGLKIVSSGNGVCSETIPSHIRNFLNLPSSYLQCRPGISAVICAVQKRKWTISTWKIGWKGGVMCWWLA